ncbi:hypothetical protein TWF225_011912 [Orbilia oligospora]|nr:hypothetical protein TWF225_011912 [Orbilia oligospora]KAF3261889.1 hypothetical protein TWF217_004447 [Orbilia oligospora]KAF3265942.1 hypothetical protein TWF128_011516 [Orbilia oligospora]KAF3290331.1 hypothetical protein TWF132_007120 [Orbilia oligospora]
MQFKLSLLKKELCDRVLWIMPLRMPSIHTYILTYLYPAPTTIQSSSIRKNKELKSASLFSWHKSASKVLQTLVTKKNRHKKKKHAGRHLKKLDPWFPIGEYEREREREGGKSLFHHSRVFPPKLQHKRGGEKLVGLHLLT